MPVSSIVSDIIRRTRQHHAIEHATIHLLSARFPGQHFSGVSDLNGFTIYGDVTGEALRQTVGAALLRLQAGEAELAIHPNCGTNLATTGILVSLVAILTTPIKRHPIDRFSMLVPLMIGALIAARPLGLHLQKYTTLASVSDRWVSDVNVVQIGNITAHRVSFD